MQPNYPPQYWHQIKLDDYIIFEYLRKDKGGGGLLTAVHKSLKPVSISEDDDVEILVVEGNINDRKTRFVNGYGPQETCNDETREKFFKTIEVKSSKLAGALVCIELDANSKLGSTIMNGDPEKEPSKNGELLRKVVEENDLIVVNATKLCKETITRYKKLYKERRKVLLTIS